MASKNKAPSVPGFASVASDHSRFENYELELKQRSEIVGAEYNPRMITDLAKKKLKDNIQQRGLMMPIVWNKRTGNVVAGHQRLDVLDSLHGGKDYALRVAVVDLDDKAEKEQNIFLNNMAAQGDWDMEKLEKVLKDDIELDKTGFDMGDIYDLFGESPFIEKPQALEVLSSSLREAHQTLANIVNKASDRDDPDFYLVIVFQTKQHRDEYTKSIGLPEDRYFSKEVFVDAVTKSVQVTDAE